MVEQNSNTNGALVDADHHQKPVSKFTRAFRSPLFNVILVGLISFTQPGIWNALNSTPRLETASIEDLC